MHLLEAGISFNHIHNNYRINEYWLKDLSSRFQKEGIFGLQNQPNIIAGYTLEQNIFLNIEENHFTLLAASQKNGINPQRIGIWLKIMHTEGIDALS